MNRINLNHGYYHALYHDSTLIMSRYNERKLSYALQNKLLNSFCGTLSRLKTKEAVYNFLKDLLNRQERLMLIRRLLIADMLIRGETYVTIRERLHCGLNTIARVQRWLNFGRGGYKEAIKLKGK